MARHDIVMPQMGESITTGTITKWHKKVGDVIEIDEILLEISTDKVESEIPAPVKGKIAALLYKEGDTIDVGKKIAEIETDLNAAIGGASATSTPTASASKAETKTAAAPVATATAVAETHVEHSDGRRFYTPLVRALAKEAGIPLSELGGVQGTGAGGRVNKEDFQNYAANRGKGAAPVATKAATPQPPASSVKAYGPNDRVEIIPMDNMRKTIMRNMVESKLTSPHVNSISEVDLTHLVKFREGFKEEFKKQEGFNLTYSPFIMYAIIQALKEYPLVNASIDGDKIVLKKDINLGCAVAVPGNGLVVPVLKSADNLNMLGLCRQLNTLANKARNKKLSMDELTGGTFTFTNVGSFGTLLATPVILQPQLGIYASGAIVKRVMVMENDAIAVRSMMYGTHTYDHRLIDGELGGKFLEAIHRHLRTMDPSALF